MGSSWHHAPASLVGVYKANLDGNKLHSWSGYQPKNQYLGDVNAFKSLPNLNN